jgi:hypothetical protein
MPLAHNEMLSQIWAQSLINPNALTTGNTVNTYDASPQPAAGVDCWDSGALLPYKCLLVIPVYLSSGSGTLTITLRDSGSAITTANGAASTTQFAALTAITASGLYVVELDIGRHVFASTATRVVAEATNDTVRRYITARAVSAGATWEFSITALFGENQRNLPTQDATLLTCTWAT